jgi:hypothetical protein
MFQKFESLAGALCPSNQNENAGDQADQVNDEDEWAEIKSKAEQTIDNDVEREQQHSESFHAPIFAVAAALCRGVSLTPRFSAVLRGEYSPETV